MDGHHGRNRTASNGTSLRTLRRKDPRPVRQGLARNNVCTKPLQCIAIDIVVDLPPCQGMHYILTAIDTFTRYAWAMPIADRTANTSQVITELRQEWGMPRY